MQQSDALLAKIFLNSDVVFFLQIEQVNQKFIHKKLYLYFELIIRVKETDCYELSVFLQLQSFSVVAISGAYPDNKTAMVLMPIDIKPANLFV